MLPLVKTPVYFHLVVGLQWTQSDSVEVVQKLAGDEFVIIPAAQLP